MKRTLVKMSLVVGSVSAILFMCYSISLDLASEENPLFIIVQFLFFTFLFSFACLNLCRGWARKAYTAAAADGLVKVVERSGRETLFIAPECSWKWFVRLHWSVFMYHKWPEEFVSILCSPDRE